MQLFQSNYKWGEVKGSEGLWRNVQKCREVKCGEWSEVMIILGEMCVLSLIYRYIAVCVFRAVRYLIICIAGVIF